MSNQFEYSYQLSFSANFDPLIITASSVPDKDDTTFQSLVQDEFNKIKNILNMYHGVSDLSTMMNYNGTLYKINVNNA